MTYESVVVIPLEARFLTLKTDQFNVKENGCLLSASLELINERREVAMVKMTRYQQKLRQGYNKGVKLRPLTSRDLVLRKVVGIAKNPSWGKLGLNWEDPYRITSIAGIETYYLEDLDENTVLRSWNVNNLCRYYY